MANGDNPNLAPIARNSTIERDSSGNVSRVLGNNFAQATSFDRSTYKVESMSYPNDLMSSDGRYGGNYVIFYINVHEDSTLYKTNTGAFVSGEVNPRLRGELAGENYNAASYRLVAGVAGAAAAQGANVAGRIAGALGADLDPKVETVANMTAGALGAQALVSALGGAKKDYKRMKQAIALHIPTDLSVRYSANWEEEGTAGTQALMAGAENAATVVGIPNAIGAGASYLAGVALKTPGVGSTLSKSSGTAANPKKEQLFDRVDFRTFTFTYQFFPRSPEEAANVRAIIQAFKLHMHPEYRDAYHFLYIYPSEFDIYYYQNGKENMNLHRHTSCVLTDLNVSYTPQGTFSTFANGMPTQINVSLTFKELALLTKETIADGF